MRSSCGQAAEAYSRDQLFDAPVARRVQVPPFGGPLSSNRMYPTSVQCDSSRLRAATNPYHRSSRSLFLEDFLPPMRGTPEVPRLPRDHFDAMPVTAIEKEMYQPFIDLIQMHGLIPGYKIVNTADFYDHDMDNARKIRPDPSMYKTSVKTAVKRTQFGELELHFELKPDNASDPFNDPDLGVDRLGHQFVRPATVNGCMPFAAHRLRNRMVFSATSAIRFHRVRRRSLCTLHSVGSRRGCGAEKFDYRNDSLPLVQFLWRFSHRDAASRGLDPTVRRAKAHEVKLAVEHLSPWAPNAERPVVVFKVLNGDGKPREFIAWGSIAHAGSLTGRCTRAYAVYEAATKRRYFLKDTWRAYDLAQEADIPRELQRPTSSISRLSYAAAISSTMSLQLIYTFLRRTRAARAKTGKTINARHGLAQGSTAPGNFIGKPLTTFKNSKQLMQVVSDAFTAHREAYTRCGIVHRDISARSLLIDDTDHGILNDWDLAKHVSDLEQARSHERTGTWQFMSCLLLMDHHSAHTIQDDIDHSPYTLGLIEDIFDYEMTNPQGTRVGGKNKRSMFKSKNYLGPGFQFTSEPLRIWMRGAFAAVKQWLDFVDPDEDDDARDLMMAIGEAAPEESSTTAATTTAPPAHLHLNDHAFMSNVFAHCLSLDWPLDDTPHDVLPEQRRALNELKRGLVGSDWTDEDGSIGGARKKSKSSASMAKSGLGSRSSHSMSARSSRSMNTRALTRQRETDSGGV
ncbi:hypothetical protein LshimejAT787_0705360 [Lyophyllum shimeji]|uniref:Protein kinase domain-containing protein n=1 Tax=Lyophyllum shimeji TaxID=47721 RepID=A0A9P3PQQ7_LYOSH|nr:hypothetical protein LshimejAT787_0705360 [Lyophyllum shimeji]